MEKNLQKRLIFTVEIAEPVSVFMSALALFSVKTEMFMGVLPLSYFTLKMPTVFNTFTCFRKLLFLLL